MIKSETTFLAQWQIETAMNSPALLFIFLIPVIVTSTADPPRPPPSVSCSDELLNFSMCLSFVAMPPNNITDSPSPQCCEDISAAHTNNSAVCLCYLARNPDILGFPVNSTKVISLSSVCSLVGDNWPSNFSLQTLCSGTAALPPLQSIRGVGSASANSPSLPAVSPSQRPGNSSPTEEEPDGKLPARPDPYIGEASRTDTSKKLAMISSYISILFLIWFLLSWKY